MIDLYSVKPADTVTLSAAAAATGGRLVVAEDHHPEGGLGAAVLDALTGGGRAELAIAHLAVRVMPGRGPRQSCSSGRHRRRLHRRGRPPPARLAAPELMIMASFGQIRHGAESENITQSRRLIIEGTIQL